MEYQTILIERDTFLGGILLKELNFSLYLIMDSENLPPANRQELLDSLTHVIFRHVKSSATHQIQLPQGDNSNVPIINSLMNSKDWELGGVRVLEESFRK